MQSRPREITVNGPTAYVPLTKGYTATVDTADLPLIDGRKWYAAVAKYRDGRIRAVYALAKENVDGRQVTLRMHRVILAAAAGEDVDHRDSDGLNNRRSNIRIATRSQNMQNRRSPTGTISGVRGVQPLPNRNGWRAEITVGRSRKHLGSFETIDEAAAAYAAASAELHGEFGRTA